MDGISLSKLLEELRKVPALGALRGVNLVEDPLCNVSTLQVPYSDLPNYNPAVADALPDSEYHKINKVLAQKFSMRLTRCPRPPRGPVCPPSAEVLAVLRSKFPFVPWKYAHAVGTQYILLVTRDNPARDDPRLVRLQKQGKGYEKLPKEVAGKLVRATTSVAFLLPWYHNAESPEDRAWRLGPATDALRKDLRYSFVYKNILHVPCGKALGGVVKGGEGDDGSDEEELVGEEDDTEEKQCSDLTAVRTVLDTLGVLIVPCSADRDLADLNEDLRQAEEEADCNDDQYEPADHFFVENDEDIEKELKRLFALPSTVEQLAEWRKQVVGQWKIPPNLSVPDAAQLVEKWESSLRAQWLARLPPKHWGHFLAAARAPEELLQATIPWLTGEDFGDLPADLQDMLFQAATTAQRLDLLDKSKGAQRKRLRAMLGKTKAECDALVQQAEAAELLASASAYGLPTDPVRKAKRKAREQLTDIVTKRPRIMASSEDEDDDDDDDDDAEDMGDDGDDGEDEHGVLDSALDPPPSDAEYDPAATEEDDEEDDDEDEVDTDTNEDED